MLSLFRRVWLNKIQAEFTDQRRARHKHRRKLHRNLSLNNILSLRRVGSPERMHSNRTASSKMAPRLVSVMSEMLIHMDL